MKKNKKTEKSILMYFFFILILSLTPVISLAVSGGKDSPVNALISQSDLGFHSGRQRTVTVVIPESGRKKVMSEEEYLCGTVAAQMPAEYEAEAIKAQAVVSYTLMRYRRLNSIPSEEQSFMTDKELKKHWGSDFKNNYSRLKSLVHSVYGEYITYNGKPILAAYHELSCGMTEDGENIWKGSYPYLAPVLSREDLCAENYRSTVRFNESEFAGICREKLGVNPDENITRKWLGECVRSDSGYVMSYKICGRDCSGQKIRNAFGLKSACFTLKHEGNEFIFDVSGSGHGVGMSKFGANLLALDGMSYKEIIAHYYKGTSIVK